MTMSLSKGWSAGFAGTVAVLLCAVFLSTPVAQEAAAACVSPPAGLIGWWPGNSNADEVMRGNNGTLRDGATFAPGRVSQAFVTNGGYVDISAPGIRTAGGTQVTVDFWMYWNGDQSVMPFGFGLGEGLPAYDLYLSNGFFGFNSGAGDLWGIESSGLANRWVHVVAIFNNGAVSGSRLFIDGAEQAMAQRMGPEGTSQVSATARLGCWPLDLDYPFNGRIDEVKIYNRALTPAEIAAVYNAGADGTCRCSRPPTGMVSWWAAEWNANDVQGVNNGWQPNGSTFSQGRVGQAFDFDGVDDTVQVPHSTSIDYGVTRTFEMWIYPTAFPGYQGLISKGVTPTLSHCLALQGDKISVYGALPAHWQPGATSLSLNTWNHVAFVQNGTAVTMYLNGVVDGQATANWSPTSDSLEIGTFNGGGYPFAGRIDEVRIYNRALSANEIRKLFNAGGTGVCNSDLAVTMKAIPATAVGGNNLLYTIPVRNSGVHVAPGVTLTDTLPPGTTFVSAIPTQGTCAQSGGSVDCILGDIGRGGLVTAALTVNVPLAADSVTNTATAATAGKDPRPANNTATRTSAVRHRPVIASLTPALKTSNVGVPQTFSAVYSDADEATDIYAVEFLASADGTASNAMHARYEAPTNTLSLYNEDGVGYAGSCAAGAPGTVSNSLATLDCGATTASSLGNDLTVAWRITPRGLFASASFKKVRLWAADNDNLSSGWQTKGKWKVNSPPTLGALDPANETTTGESAAYFLATYSDADGLNNLKKLDFLVTKTGGSADALYVSYAVATNTLTLHNNAGTGVIGTCHPGEDGIVLQNDQGRLLCSGVWIEASGNDLSVNWALQPKAAFASAARARALKMRAADLTGATTNWQSKGTWKISP